jgi:hypothetical protein
MKSICLSFAAAALLVVAGCAEKVEDTKPVTPAAPPASDLGSAAAPGAEAGSTVKPGAPVAPPAGEAAPGTDAK